MDTVDVVTQRWYAHPDDLVGGWCAMNVDKRPSAADHRRGEFEVVSFTSEAVARHVADLHNRWLGAERGEAGGPTSR